MYFYTFIHSTQSIVPQRLQQYRKKCVTFLSGEGGGVGGGSPDERPYDVSRGQNRYVTPSFQFRAPKQSIDRGLATNEICWRIRQ